MDTTIDNLEQKTQGLEVTENAKKYLKTTSSWINFLAILDFISIGFLIFYGIIMLISSGAMADIDTIFLGSMTYISVFVGTFCLAVGVIAFFPTLYLFRFAKKTTKALANQDTLVMEDAFKNMKSYWKFTGIMTIISIALCIISIPIIIIAVASAATMF